MERRGRIVKLLDDRGKLLVFSTIVHKGEWGLESRYLIGYSLTTGKVEQELDMFTHDKSVDIGELSVEESQRLAYVLPAYHVLTKRTLAITAKARSGKDFTAAKIANQSPKDSAIIPLAEPIKLIVEAIEGESDTKNRPALIMVGQGLRKEDPNIWIKVWLRRAIKRVVEKKVDRVICQDLRQPNEFSFFTNLGATVLKIEADHEGRMDTISKLDGSDALADALLKDETEENAGSYETSHTLFNDYTPKYGELVHDFYYKVLVAEKGWT